MAHSLFKCHNCDKIPESEHSSGIDSNYSIKRAKLFPLTYSTAIIGWNEKEMKDLDRKTQMLVTL